MRKTAIAAACVAALLLTAPAASAQVCVLGIFVAAAAVGTQQHRELTTEEAATCGLSSLFEKPKAKAEAKKQKKEVAQHADNKEKKKVVQRAKAD